MAELTHEDVRRIARLSKLLLSDEEVETERTRLAAVLGYVEHLRTLDLGNAEPMARASAEPPRLREDTPAEPLDPGVLADLAPDISETHDAEGHTQRYIRVPRVLGEAPA